jgi:hypothetical protein
VCECVSAFFALGASSSLYLFLFDFFFFFYSELCFGLHVATIFREQGMGLLEVLWGILVVVFFFLHLGLGSLDRRSFCWKIWFLLLLVGF